ncbi:unnamed protein product [Ectocarpus sp. 12 AP-2014]
MLAQLSTRGLLNPHTATATATELDEPRRVARPRSKSRPGYGLYVYISSPLPPSHNKQLSFSHQLNQKQSSNKSKTRKERRVKRDVTAVCKPLLQHEQTAVSTST